MLERLVVSFRVDGEHWNTVQNTDDGIIPLTIVTKKLEQ